MSRLVPASLIKALLILAATVWWTTETILIPENFTTKDISAYTIRYLSEDGNDTESCLSGPVYAQNHQANTSIANDTVKYFCRSLVYALTGGHYFRFRNVSNLIVLILPGIYSMGERGIEIFDYRNIILSKMSDTSGEVVVKCDEFIEVGFNNLFIKYTSNLVLNEIVFTECGPHASPVRLQNTVNATVSKCTFRNNLNCGLTVDRSAQIYITSSSFHDNNSSAFYYYTDRLDPGVFRFGGGLLLSWNSTDSSELSNTAVVNNCNFFRNYAGIDARNRNDTRPHFYSPRGHGGAIVVAFKNASSHTLVVNNTRIYENTAHFGGGGIILSFFKNASNNTVTITNTSFVNNTCSTSGGAINMNAFEIANGNTLIVSNSTFEWNTANIGGGAASINLRDNLQSTMSEVNELVTNTATFVNCTFANNTSPAGTGSAVRLVSNLRVDQLVAATNFTNCMFYGNQAERQSAVLSFRYPIVFNGVNIFKANRGGGVTLQQTNMDVSGTLHFEDNSAESGGAISLEDLCVIYLLRGSKMTFVRNTAETRGGAIFALFPSDSNVLPIFNTRCFIQYKVNIELDSSQWDASLIFINNTAGRDGAAIYATSIVRCIYTSTNVTGATTYDNSIFQVSPPFIFMGNMLSTAVERKVATLATAPSQLIVTPSSVTAAPGETVNFLVMAIDQAGNPQEAIWSVTEESESEEESTFDDDDGVGDFFGSLIDGINHSIPIRRVDKDLYYKSCYTGIPRLITFSLVQAIAGDVSSGKTVEVTVTCCHPGYHFDNKTEVCEHNHNDTNIVRPGANNRYLYTKDNIYVDKYEIISNTTEELKTAVIPPTVHKCEKQGVQPGCKFRFDSLEEQCSERREGFLCGKCPDEEGVDLTLRQCKNCTILDAIIVAIIVVAFIITSIFVLYFNIGVPNELRGCLFFVQVVGFVYQSSRTEEITWDYHLSRVFGSGLYLPLCPAPGFRALYTAIYGLLFSLLAIAILWIYIISARFSSRLSSRSSFDGIWFLSIITYKYTADTCFNLLRCQKVSGKGISGEFVYYYDGTVPCFQSTHLYISIVALLLSISVVVPFPLLIFVISFRRYKFTQPFTDVLNKDIKVSCRWWSGFDLLRRLLFISVVFFFNYVQPRYTQLALLFTGLLTYIIFASAKPYKTKWANIIEAIVLLNLLLLTTFFLNINLSKNNQFVRILEQILLLLPFLSILLYIVIRLASLMWNKVSRKSFKMLFKDITAMDRKQHTTVSHNLELITNMEIEETTDPDSEDFRSTDSAVYREELLEN